MSKPKVTCWKFVKHEVSMTLQDAQALASQIEAGTIRPVNSYGERFYKLGGWCFDLGRKPYLIEYTHGQIERKWALSVAELRQACYLKRGDKVIPDPFFHLQIEEDDAELMAA